ncbi:hypothetical protein IGI86_002344 [Enterococcus sp. AZ188]|uniref:hypothetical protein n=1 Tax=Enterococcus sp. AZ188 TaxID=2774678 RepID=UPI003D2F9D40
MKKQIIATSIILASITTVIATEAQANADSINGVDVTTDQTQKKATSENGETWVNDNNVWYNQTSGDNGIITPPNTPGQQKPEQSLTPAEPNQTPPIIKQETPSAPSVPTKAEYIAPAKPISEQKVPNTPAVPATPVINVPDLQPNASVQLVPATPAVPTKAEYIAPVKPVSEQKVPNTPAVPATPVINVPDLQPNTPVQLVPATPAVPTKAEYIAPVKPVSEQKLPNTPAVPATPVINVPDLQPNTPVQLVPATPAVPTKAEYIAPVKPVSEQKVPNTPFVPATPVIIVPDLQPNASVQLVPATPAVPTKAEYIAPVKPVSEQKVPNTPFVPATPVINVPDLQPNTPVQLVPATPAVPTKAEYIAPVKPVSEQKVPNKKYEDPINKQLKEVPSMIPSQPAEMTLNVPIKKFPQMNTFNFSMQEINTFATTIIDNTFSTNTEKITPATNVLVEKQPSLIDGDIPKNLNPFDHKQFIQASRVPIIEKPVIMKLEQLSEQKTSRPVPKTSEEKQTIKTIQFKTALMKSESKQTAQSLTKKENQVNRETIPLPTRSSRHDVKSTLLKSSSLAMMPKTGDADSFTFQESLRIIGFVLASLSLLGLSFKSRKGYKK